MKRLLGVLAALSLALPSTAAEVAVPALPDLALPTATPVSPAIGAAASYSPLPALAQTASLSASAVPVLPMTVVPEALAPAPVPAAQAARAGGAGSAAEPPRTQLYILTRTIDRTVELGPAARAGHYILEAGWQAAKMALGYKLGGVGGALAAAVVEVPWAPLSLASRSLLQLGWRSARQRGRTLRALAQEPGVSGVKLLSGGPVEFDKFLARRQTNHVLAMIEAPAGQPGLETAYGRAVPVRDFDRTVFNLALSVYGEKHPIEWRVSLRDVLARRPLPPAIAAAWKDALSLHKRALGWVRWLFTSRLERETRMDMTLVTSDGEEHALGLLAHGKAAFKLARGKKGVPLMEARVVRRPRRRAPLRWLDAFLGREIVVGR